MSGPDESMTRTLRLLIETPKSIRISLYDRLSACRWRVGLLRSCTGQKPEPRQANSLSYD